MSAEPQNVCDKGGPTLRAGTSRPLVSANTAPQEIALPLQPVIAGLFRSAFWSQLHLQGCPGHVLAHQIGSFGRKLKPGGTLRAETEYGQPKSQSDSNYQSVYSYTSFCNRLLCLEHNKTSGCLPKALRKYRLLDWKMAFHIRLSCPAFFTVMLPLVEKPRPNKTDG